MKLEDKLKSLPETPGVYLMKDKEKNIMYVGKSKSLKNRVSQYFLPSYNPSKKITRMIKFIDDIDIITTDTELDALILECELIKKLKPMYNTLMKNDKKYAYLRINIKEDYPTLECITHKSDSGLCFGPYMSIQKLENIVEVLRKYFKLRTCKGNSVSKGCINYELGFCMGPCKTKKQEEYNNSINKLINTLNGENYDLINSLNKKMLEEVNALNFEKASKFKEILNGMSLILSRSAVISYIRESKIIITSIDLDDSRKKVYVIQGIEVLYSKIVGKDFEEERLKESFLQQEYKKCNKHEKCKSYIEKEDLDMANTIYSYLKSKSKLDFI